MLNIIRADMYRIFRSKGIYITGIIFLATLLLQIFTNGTIGIGAGLLPDTVDKLPALGANAPFIMMAEMDMLLYILLALIVFIASADFSSGAVKNVLSNGISRTIYYISKLLLSCIFCVVLLAINIIVPTILATISNGFGGTFDMAYVVSVLKPFLLQLFLFVSATCVGIFLVFVFKRTAAVNGIYIAWLLVPIIILLMLIEGISENFTRLTHYDLTLNMKMLANFSTISTGDIIRALLIGTFYIVISTVLGLLIFRKSEIK